MQKNITPRLIPALLAIAFSGTASASGFQLLEQNGSGLGNAYAGSAAAAENASVQFFNPAAMTQLAGRNASLGLVLVNTSFELDNQGSSTGVFTNAGNGGDAGGLGFIPNAYLSWQVAQDWWVGLGIGAPFGLKTEYNTAWLGSAHSNSFDIKTYNINPSVAWRANELISVGAGVSWQRMDATYKKATAAGPATLPGLGTVPLYLFNTELDADDTSWNWNVGVLLTPAEKTKIGLSYRSTTSYTLSGNLSTSGPSPVLASALSSSAKADIKLPDTFVFSVTQGIGDNWEVLGDISWTGWSSVPYVDIVATSGLNNGRTVQTLDTKFNDTWRFALGANYKLNEQVKLRTGIAYDNTPVPDAQHRLASLPDNDRTWLSVGAQYKPTKDSALDVGFAYLFVKDAPINNLTASGGLIKGTYSDSAWILGGQYSMGF
jgi:long-chain fatty acid transport protein